MTVWDEVLGHVQQRMPAEDFRRWFGSTWFASDSGDQITVWVPSEAIRRHIETHYDDVVLGAVAALGRKGTFVRFAVSGTGDDEDEPE